MSDDGRRPSAGPRTPTWQLYVYDVVSALLGVLLVGGLLLAVSGVWPPLVAIESGSMEPHIDTGDLVFVMDEHRFASEGAHGETGVVTARVGSEMGYRSFQQPGDVIVYEPGGNGEDTPIIHRAMFWVEDNESWYESANPDYVGTYDDCTEMPQCPAENAGFITKGDDNDDYDQISSGQSKRPVKPEWIIGTAEVRLPGLGQLRLGFEGVAGEAPVEANGSNVSRTGR